MIRHIIFDLDGTLVDTAPLCAGIVNAMLHGRGSRRAVTPDEARACLTRGGADTLAVLLGGDGGDMAIELAEFRGRYAELPTPQDSLFPGVRDGLGHLVGLGVRMAVCSNKPQHLCEKIVSELGLDFAISAVAGSQPDCQLKPEPDLALLALAGLDALPDECLYIGDSEVDLLTARAAGIPFLLVTYGYAEPGWSPTGLTAVDSFAELVRLVEAPSHQGAELPRVA